MVVRIGTKKPISKAILVVSLLVVLLIFPLVLRATNTTNALKLSITSIKYDFWWLSDNNNSYFLIYSNITIENTSLKKITIIFGDGCLWDTQLECSFTNESLNYSFDEGTCTMATVPITFQPGITLMGDFVELRIYNYTLPMLPEGKYTIIIGEEYSEYNEEIKDSGRSFFEVKDGILFDFAESSFNRIDFTSAEVLMISIMILSVAYGMFRKRKRN
jgi:hypothetical protein